MSWFANPAFHDKDKQYSEKIALKVTKRLGEEMFFMTDNQKSLHNIFSVLNRRRIDNRPLQKCDILSEIEAMTHKDLALIIIESIDSFWLKRLADEIRKKNGA